MRHVKMIEHDRSDPWDATVFRDQLPTFVRWGDEVYERVGPFEADGANRPCYRHRPDMRGQRKGTGGRAVPGWL